MTGLLLKKYHIAVFNEDEEFVQRILSSLKSWYENRIIVETYTDSYSMFEAVNTSKVKNRPFDLAIFNSDEYAGKMVLKQTSPSLQVLLCKDEASLKKETSKILL